jgi:L-threonylcarbamoyladenylate synthase
VRRIVVAEASVSETRVNESLKEAVRAIRAGGVVALPTDTLYGLAVDARQADAVRRVFAVKGRAAHQALPLVAADTAQVVEHIGSLAPHAARLAARFWPGPLTLLFEVPALLAPGVSAGTGRVGVRVPAHAVTRALCRACGCLLTATSANISGSQPSANPDEVALALGDRIDVLVDAGTTPGGLASTIVDVTGEIPALVRAGAIEWGEIAGACGLGTV